MKPYLLKKKNILFVGKAPIVGISFLLMTNFSFSTIIFIIFSRYYEKKRIPPSISDLEPDQDLEQILWIRIHNTEY